MWFDAQLDQKICDGLYAWPLWLHEIFPKVIEVVQQKPLKLVIVAHKKLSPYPYKNILSLVFIKNLSKT